MGEREGEGEGERYLLVAKTCDIFSPIDLNKPQQMCTRTCIHNLY